jgi:hypothetical protein
MFRNGVNTHGIIRLFGVFPLRQVELLDKDKLAVIATFS